MVSLTLLPPFTLEEVIVFLDMPLLLLFSTLLVLCCLLVVEAEAVAREEDLIAAGLFDWKFLGGELVPDCQVPETYDDDEEVLLLLLV